MCRPPPPERRAAPIQTEPPRPAAAGTDAWPPPRRSFALPGVILAMLLVAALSGSYMVWHTPLAPDLDGGQRCTRAFEARLHTARGGSDADLLRLSDEALAAGCGRQAHDAADLVGADAVARLCARPAAATDAALKTLCPR